MKTVNKKGFTLIEVVLVLAIGGLIFLLAFLAFQQVSRNRRDTQRRSDVGRMAAIASDIQANSPTSVSLSTACTTDGTDGGNWSQAIYNTPNLDDPTTGNRYDCQSSASTTVGHYWLTATEACVRLESGSNACRDVE